MIKIATIAGSDASGGAGLEADLKTFAEYALYCMAVVTVIATMNPDSNWSHAVWPIEEAVLRAQAQTVFAGVKPDAVKSGMLGTEYAVELTREYVSKYGIAHYVLDPVMVCKGAGEALNPELNRSIAAKLVPLAQVVTPNLFEAEQLSGLKTVNSIETMKEAARIIAGQGAGTVFIKGGSKLPNAASAIDILFDGTNFETLEAPLIKTSYTHGAGCTTASAIACALALGLSVPAAVESAKKFISTSLSHGFALNQWVGPGNPSAWRQGFLSSGVH